MNDDEKNCTYCGKMLEVKDGNTTRSETITYKTKGKKYTFCPTNCFLEWSKKQNKESELAKNEPMDKSKNLPKNEYIDKSSSFSAPNPEKCDNCGKKIQEVYFGWKIGGKEDKEYWFCSSECLGKFSLEKQNQASKKIKNNIQSLNTSNSDGSYIEDTGITQKEPNSPKSVGKGGWLIALIVLLLVIVGGIIFYYVGKRKGK